MFRILVVGDHPPTTGITALYVAMLEYEAVQSHVLADAMAILHHQEVDVLVADLELFSMSAFDLAARMRREAILLPVVVMAPVGAAVDAIRAKQLGICAVIEDPVSLSALGAALAKVLQPERSSRPA